MLIIQIAFGKPCRWLDVEMNHVHTERLGRFGKQLIPFVWLDSRVGNAFAANVKRLEVAGVGRMQDNGQGNDGPSLFHRMESEKAGDAMTVRARQLDQFIYIGIPFTKFNESLIIACSPLQPSSILNFTGCLPRLQ